MAEPEGIRHGMDLGTLVTTIGSCLIALVGFLLSRTLRSVDDHIKALWGRLNAISDTAHALDTRISVIEAHRSEEAERD